VRKIPQILIVSGIVLIVTSLLLLILIFLPIAKVEFSYNLNQPHLKINEIKPIDRDFGIVIPKIGANAKIIADVNPYNASIYQLALTKGVAQALGSAKPNETGNMFIFSHSSVNLLEAARYNSVFYLLAKLQKNDEIYIYYKNVRYTYKVSDIKIVDAKEVSYLSPESKTKTLTLMTCWPEGTTYKRLLVIATGK